MDGGAHGWVANCSTPPTRDEAAHEWAPGTHDLYSENPTRGFPISAIYGQAFMGSSIEMVDRCNSVQSRRAMKTGLRPLPTSVRQYSTLGGTWG